MNEQQGYSKKILSSTFCNNALDEQRADFTSVRES
jgi:hypothetical protein